MKFDFAMKCHLMTTCPRTSRLLPVIRRRVAMGILLAFFVNCVAGPVSSPFGNSPAFAQAALPLPTSMVTLSDVYAPTLIKGMRVYPENPLRFDFIIDSGDSGLQGREFEQESSKLMKYFLSSLTVPEKELWVNLSPYEEDRIIPDAFGKTEMGRDMLAQDYILKQLSASVLYPDSEIGKSFWDLAYKKARETFGSSDLPINTFNKIWIVPEKAVVYARNNIAYVTQTHLKVMLEEDYVALANQGASAQSFAPAKDVALQNDQMAADPKAKDSNAVGSQAVREVILPAIEKEVNEGRNFAPLRQVYNSLILATWFKRNLKESILGKIYVGQNKVEGVTFGDTTDKDKIYADYLEAFKTGVYNFIKEQEDPVTKEMIPRKYFSGGIPANMIGQVLEVTDNESAVSSSAVVKPGKTTLVAMELGRPKAAQDSDIQPASNWKAGDFNILRDNRAFGLQKEIFSGQFSPSGQSMVINAFPEATINTFKRAIADGVNSEDPVQSLKNLRPMIEYLIEKTEGISRLPTAQVLQLMKRAKEINAQLLPIAKFEQEAAEAKKQADYLLAEYEKLTSEFVRQPLRKKIAEAELRYSQLQDVLVQKNIESGSVSLRRELASITLDLNREFYSKKMRDFFEAGSNLSAPNARDLLTSTVELIGELSADEVRQFFGDAQARVQAMMMFLSKIKQDSLPMDGLTVQFAVNAPDVFALKTAADGKPVLVVDLMSFVKQPTKAQIVMWRYEFLNLLEKEKRQQVIAQYLSEKRRSSFITQNPRVVAEVMRTMFFMNNVIDDFYKIDRAVPPIERQVAVLQGAEFMEELSSDEHYGSLSELVAQLLRNVTDPDRKGTRKAQISARIETILRAAGAFGLYTPNDIAALAEAFQKIKKGTWYLSKSVEKALRDDASLTVLTDAVLDDQQAVAAAGETAARVAPTRPKKPAVALVRPVLSDIQSNTLTPKKDEAMTFTDKNAQALQDAFEEAANDSSWRSLFAPVKRWALVGALAGAAAFWGLWGGDALVKTTTEAKEGFALSAWVERVKRQQPEVLTNLWNSIQKLKKSWVGEEDKQLINKTPPEDTVEDTRQKVFEMSSLAFAVIPLRSGEMLADVATRYKLGDADLADRYKRGEDIRITEDSQVTVLGVGALIAANGFNSRNMKGITSIVLPGHTQVYYEIQEDNISIKKVLDTLYGDGNYDAGILRDFMAVNNLRSQQELKSGMVVTAVVSIERARKLASELNARNLKVSAAAPVVTDNVGGINLDPSGLEIRTEGENFKFDVPIDPVLLQNLQQEPVNGFVPVILNVVPIFNLPQFLGVQKPATANASLALQTR